MKKATPARARPEGFTRLPLDRLTIEDEASFRHVPIYGDLRRVLLDAGYTFRVLPANAASWDRALLLNLTFWGAAEGGDVLVGRRIPADVVAHAAWHHLAARALGLAGGGRPSAHGLFLGEAIASAFDLYLVGRLLGRAPRSTFLATQVPAMAETTQRAGLSARGFERLLGDVAEDPERAFADLRALLGDATAALFSSRDAEAGLAALQRLGGHRFAPLLHRYELASWVLYARAYGSAAPDPRAAAVERALRRAKDPLGWLTRAWLAPGIAA